MRVRRARLTYLCYLLWVGFILLKIFTSNINAFTRYAWCFALLITIAVLIRILFKRNYFEIRNEQLIIYRHLFYEEKIDIDRIQEIKLEEGIFSTSIIKLRNPEKEISFNYYFINDNDFDAFKQVLKVPVS
jgi:uncharacterized membrane protein YdbT with pleckstrin-like domain